MFENHVTLFLLVSFVSLLSSVQDLSGSSNPTQNLQWQWEDESKPPFWSGFVVVLVRAVLA